jgi:hypothetical protein
MMDLHFRSTKRVYYCIGQIGTGDALTDHFLYVRVAKIEIHLLSARDGDTQRKDGAMYHTDDFA